MYESSTEFNLNRAIESIKLGQQVHKRELEKKDEKIQKLVKKLEALQSEKKELLREFSEFKESKEDESSYYRELVSDKQFMQEKLSLEHAKNEELKEELLRVRQDLSAQEKKVAHLELENEKANHIIKNLLRKLQSKPQQPLPHQHRDN